MKQVLSASPRHLLKQYIKLNWYLTTVCTNTVC